MEWFRLLLWVWGMVKEKTGALLKARDIARYSGIRAVKLERIMMDTGRVMK